MLVPPADRAEADRLRAALAQVKSSLDPLPGLTDEDRLEVLVGQLIESERRMRYLDRLLGMQLSPVALQGTSVSFDPLKGAILKLRAGEHDEACWLVLLSTHFGRSRRTGWQLSGDFYGRLGEGGTWDWISASGDIIEMRRWLEAHRAALRARGGVFGNHRKYESLNAWKPSGTGNVLATYIEWIGEDTHERRFGQIAANLPTRRERFAALYQSLGPVARFGRTARFDFLNTLGRLGLADVEADSAHLAGATGPLAGARLLFDGRKESRVSARSLEERLELVQRNLDIPFDVLEDALCNWQKSPANFVPFRG